MSKKIIISNLDVVEEPMATENVIKKTIKKPRKPITPKPKLNNIKVQPMPETYIEDTFDLDSQITEVKIIENKTNVKHKNFISRDELLESPQFKTKFKKITARIEFEKSFDFLLDYVESTKLLKSKHIDNEIDEYDVILEEVVLYFKKRLKRINLTYEIYEMIDNYFNSFKSLYGRFKRMELSENDELVAELEKIKSMSNFIKYYIF